MSATVYIEIAIVTICALAFGLYIAWQIKQKGLKKFIVDCIVYAEKNIKYNEDKFNYVVEKVIAIIPTPFSLFITTSAIEKLVQSTFDLCKVALDYREEQ